MTTCGALKKGQSGTVVMVDGDENLRLRLEALGVRPGAEIRFVRSAPLGCPVELAVQYTHVALRREDAARILVQAA